MKKIKFVLVSLILMVSFSSQVSGQVPSNWKLVKTISNVNFNAKTMEYDIKEENTAFLVKPEVPDFYTNSVQPDWVWLTPKTGVYENLLVYLVTEKIPATSDHPEITKKIIKVIGAKTQTSYCYDAEISVTGYGDDRDKKRQFIIELHNYTYDTHTVIFDSNTLNLNSTPKTKKTTGKK